MELTFVSPELFKKRTAYTSDWNRIEPFNRVALDLVVIPLIGELNAETIRGWIDAGNFDNIQQQTLVEGFILDYTVNVMAYYAAPVLWNHLNNAGTTAPDTNPVSTQEAKMLADYYLKAAEGIAGLMVQYYKKHSALLGLPQPIFGCVEHSPFVGVGLNIDLNINPITQETVTVPKIDINLNFFYGLLDVGEELTLEKILAGTNIATADEVSWIPNNGKKLIWFAVDGANYQTWSVNNDTINNSTIHQDEGLFRTFALNEFNTYQQNYISEMDSAVLTVKT